MSEKEKDYHVYYPENSLIASNRHSIQTNLSQERKHWLMYMITERSGLGVGP